MKEDVMDNDLIKKIQKIEEKYLNKYVRDDLKDLINDVIHNKCKDFKENVFYKQVKEIDNESNDFGFKNHDYQNKKNKSRLRVYSDSEDENDEIIKIKSKNK